MPGRDSGPLQGYRQALIVSGSLVFTALLLAVAILASFRYPAVGAALAGAAPVALGAALAGAYRLEQRFVTDRGLGLVFLGALGVAYMVLRRAPAALDLYWPAVFLVAWFLGPAAWAAGKALDSWLQAGISPAARAAGAAVCGVLLAALIPLAAVTIDDLASGAAALLALTLRLVTRIPVGILLAAGALLRLLLPWSIGTG